MDGVGWADRLASAAAGASGEERDLRQRAGRTGIVLLDQSPLGPLQQPLAPLADALPEKISAVAGKAEQIPLIEVHRKNVTGYR
jgi:hypothetical protein